MTYQQHSVWNVITHYVELTAVLGCFIIVEENNSKEHVALPFEEGSVASLKGYIPVINVRTM